MKIIYIWFCFIFIFISCHSSSESSFQSLNQAFISWYFKYHPVESTRYGMEKYNGHYRKISLLDNAEYLADITRFIIELSQIDATKLSPEKHIDYNILYSNLMKIKFIMNEIRPWEWNPGLVLDEILEGLFLLCERREIDMEDRAHIQDIFGYSLNYKYHDKGDGISVLYSYASPWLYINNGLL